MRANAEIPRIDSPGSQLRPSIETAMHVVLPHRVVAHVHSINTVAWAVRRDAPEQLAKRLVGLRWRWIPYEASGIPLATQIEKVVAHSPKADVFILANHGLVICGDDCTAVEAVLRDIEGRLAITPRNCPETGAALAAAVAHSSEWHLPDFPALHALGADVISRKILKGGILYPCQAIFLGLKVRTLPHSVPLFRFAEFANGRNGVRTFVVIDGGGVIINNQITQVEQATLIGLMQVIQRTDEFAPLQYLTEAQLKTVSGHDAHSYLHQQDWRAVHSSRF
jgi:hypothetical protein